MTVERIKKLVDSIPTSGLTADEICKFHAVTNLEELKNFLIDTELDVASKEEAKKILRLFFKRKNSITDRIMFKLSVFLFIEYLESSDNYLDVSLSILNNGKKHLELPKSLNHCYLTHGITIIIIEDYFSMSYHAEYRYNNGISIDNVDVSNIIANDSQYCQWFKIPGPGKNIIDNSDKIQDCPDLKRFIVSRLNFFAKTYIDNIF